MASGYTGDCPLVNPMCGSGTLLTEAAMIACKIPAGINRPGYGFQRWKDYDQELYTTIFNASLNKARDFPYRIRGIDKAPSAIRKAQQNIDNARLGEYISLEQADFFETAKVGSPPLHMVSNPPYGERLPIDRDSFFSSWGDTLKRNYPNTRAWLLVGDPEILKLVGLRPSRKIKLYNGGIESRLALFDIYAGSKKDRTA